MRKYIYIALFGSLGAMVRHLCYSTDFFSPTVTTLLINVLGSFALAVLLAVSFSNKHISLNIKLGLCVGFLGGFTTFSTLCKEIYILTLNLNYSEAALYIAVSVILGSGAVYAGNALEKGAL